MTRVILAGGGTAGHTSPLIATAEQLKADDPAVDLLCVGTRRGLETKVVPEAGLELVFVDPVPLPRSLGKDTATLPFRLTKAVAQARGILKRHGADVVCGFGGYAALPVFLAARTLGIPVVVHEQNAVPGVANKIAARFAATVAVTFPNTGLRHQIQVGLPVRQAIAGLDRWEHRAGARAVFGLPADGHVLLVSGGSQGAVHLNDVVEAALGPLFGLGVSVLHATGLKNYDAPVTVPDHDETRVAYRRVAYLDHMEQGYAAADLMLARAGAGTVTETAIVGLPAIFVPLPHGNGEQEKNARGLVDAGAGRLIANADLTVDSLVAAVGEMTGTPGLLDGMSREAMSIMPRDAAARLARLIEQAAGQGSHG